MAAQNIRYYDSLGRLAVFMLESFPITLVIGVVLGTLAGLGLGGGSLLLLWLTTVLSMPYPLARSINLLFFLPSAGITCLFRVKKGSLQVKRILPAIIAGSIVACIFSFIFRNLELSMLKRLFGILLLATGLRELFYRPRNAK